MRKTILWRWIVSCIIIGVLLLTIIAVTVGVGVRQFYYSNAEAYIEGKMTELITEYAIRRDADKSLRFSDIAAQIITSSTDRDLFEVMAIEDGGRVIMTSSGFSPTAFASWGDYDQALDSVDERAHYIGTSSQGEPAMSLCVILAGEGAEKNALRVMISLGQIDDQISQLFYVVFGFSAVLILALLILSTYFLYTVTKPVGAVAEVTRKYAVGDFSERLSPKRDDEVGRLMNAVNYMADELQENDRLKSEFVSSISHELRTPLTAIKSWGETLEQIDDEQTRKKGVSIIIKETDRLTEMVEKLLDFSSLQSDRAGMNMNREVCDLREIVEQVVDVYLPKAQGAGIELVIVSPKHPIYVDVDIAQIKQVLINLLDNALKYTEKGGYISVSVGKAWQSATLTVRDNGNGISSGDLPKVMDRFYKGQSAKKGSGIGLSVVRRIMELHGGQIWIESTLGKGTTVNLRIPATKETSPGSGENGGTR